MTVPSLTVGPVTTPKIMTPSITTPSVSTPSIPPVHTPTVGSPVSPPHLGSISPVAGARRRHLGLVCSVGAGTSASGTRSTSRTPSGGPAVPGRRAAAPRAGTHTMPAPRRYRAERARGHARKKRRRTSPRDPCERGHAALDRVEGLEPSDRNVQQVGQGFPTAFLVALLAFRSSRQRWRSTPTCKADEPGRSRASGRRAVRCRRLQSALLPAVPPISANPTSRWRTDRRRGSRPERLLRCVQALARPDGHHHRRRVRAWARVADPCGACSLHAQDVDGGGAPLPEVLARADRYLTGELGDGFATVVICCYEHATGELTWAKAGHEPPIVAAPPEREEQAATPLGFGMGETWPQFSRVLTPGDRVCLFTDGLTEARRHGAQLGRAHLKSLVDQGLSARRSWSASRRTPTNPTMTSRLWSSAARGLPLSRRRPEYGRRRPSSRRTPGCRAARRLAGPSACRRPRSPDFSTRRQRPNA